MRCFLTALLALSTHVLSDMPIFIRWRELSGPQQEQVAKEIKAIYREHDEVSVFLDT